MTAPFLFRKLLRSIRNIRSGKPFNSDDGATIVEAAVIFGVVVLIAVVLIVSVIPRVSDYSSRSQVAEAVGMATGYRVSLGDTAGNSLPDPAVTKPSLVSFANLLAGNSVPTCTFLVATVGSRTGSNCDVLASEYDHGLIPPQGSDHTGTQCASKTLNPRALEKVSRLAKSDCDARAYYGVSQPLNETLANSSAQHAVQKASAAKDVLYTTGGT